MEQERKRSIHLMNISQQTELDVITNQCQAVLDYVFVCVVYSVNYTAV